MKIKKKERENGLIWLIFHFFFFFGVFNYTQSLLSIRIINLSIYSRGPHTIIPYWKLETNLRITFLSLLLIENKKRMAYVFSFFFLHSILLLRKSILWMYAFINLIERALDAVVDSRYWLNKIRKKKKKGEENCEVYKNYKKRRKKETWINNKMSSRFMFIKPTSR